MLPGHTHRVVVASLNICRWGVGCHAQTGRKRQSYDPQDKSLPVIGSWPNKGIHPGTHPWTHTDIQCLRRQGWERRGPLLWCNLSLSSHNSQLLTIPANVAAPQEQKFTLLGVVRSHPLMYGVNVLQNPWPNKQLEVGQPTCLRGSSWSLQSAHNQLGKG